MINYVHTFDILDVEEFTRKIPTYATRIFWKQRKEGRERGRVVSINQDLIILLLRSSYYFQRARLYRVSATTYGRQRLFPVQIFRNFFRKYNFEDPYGQTLHSSEAELNLAIIYALSFLNRRVRLLSFWWKMNNSNIKKKNKNKIKHSLPYASGRNRLTKFERTKNSKTQKKITLIKFTSCSPVKTRYII